MDINPTVLYTIFILNATQKESGRANCPTAEISYQISTFRFRICSSSQIPITAPKPQRRIQLPSVP